MKKISHKGVLLMGASAVIILIIPFINFASQKKIVPNGRLYLWDRNFNGHLDLTCIANEETEQDCHDTISNNIAGPSFSSTGVVEDTSFTSCPGSNTTDL